MADTDIICEPEVQKSALNVIINLVCAPSDMVSSFDEAVGVVASCPNPSFPCLTAQAHGGVCGAHYQNLKRGGV